MINYHHNYSLLRDHIETYSKLADSEWEMLLPNLETRRLRKNELFIQEGKRAHEIGFVTDGMFRQFYSNDGM